MIFILAVSTIHVSGKEILPADQDEDHFLSRRKGMVWEPGKDYLPGLVCKLLLFCYRRFGNGIDHHEMGFQIIAFY